MTEADLDEIESHAEECGPWGAKQVRALVAEVGRLWQVIVDYADHDPGCPKKYAQPDMWAAMRTEGICECGLDEEAGWALPEESRISDSVASDDHGR